MTLPSHAMPTLARMLLVGCLGGLSIRAGSFNVNPVRIELSARQANASVAVRNLGDEPSVVQVRAVRWMSRGNGEEFQETDEILLNPPIFSLSPSQVQYVRLGLRHPASGAAEVSYRLILEEVPPPPKPGFTGIMPLLQIRIPAFVKPATKTSPDLVWNLSGTQENWKLSARNQGNAHVQLKRIVLAPAKAPAPQPNAGGQSGAQRAADMNVYVLPGGGHEWDLGDNRNFPPGGVLLTAHTDQGEIHAVLVPDIP